MSEAIAQSRMLATTGAVALLGDHQIARLAARGNTHAFAAIYKRYADPLYRYCHSIVGDPDDARDALQNTMANVLRALPGERREIALKPWLYRIAHNESIAMVRQHRPHAELDEASEVASPSVEHQSATRQRLRELTADIAQLPERQRGALVMRELSGLGFEEIAGAFGTSPAVAKQTVYEARVALQELAAGRAMQCDAVRQAISANDRRVLRGRRIRAHLRDCAGCRDFGLAIGARRSDLAALAPPLPVAVAASLLDSLLRGGGGGGGGTLLSLLGGGAGKTLATSAAIKGAAVLAVAAGLGAATLETSETIGDTDPAARDSSRNPRPSETASWTQRARSQGDQARGKTSKAGGGNPVERTRGREENGSPGQIPRSAAGPAPISDGTRASPGTGASSGNGPEEAPGAPQSPGAAGAEFGHQIAESYSPVPLPPPAQSHPTGPPPGAPAPPVSIPVAPSVPGGHGAPEGIPSGRP